MLVMVPKSFYRPQTKFAKVMFSQVPVCPQGVGGVCLWSQAVSASGPQRRGRHSPGQTPPYSVQTPPGQTPPWADTPSQTDVPTGQTPPLGKTAPLGGHSLGRHTSPGQTSPVQCMLGYGQQAGGTHATGMHSCYPEGIFKKNWMPVKVSLAL